MFSLFFMSLSCFGKSVNISLHFYTKIMVKISVETQMKIANLKRKITQGMARWLGIYRKQCSNQSKNFFSFHCHCFKWKETQFKTDKWDDRMIVRISVLTLKLISRQMTSECSCNWVCTCYSRTAYYEKNNLNEHIAEKRAKYNWIYDWSCEKT